MSEHEFVLDLTAHELARRAHVLDALGPGWDPVAVLEGEGEAYARLYGDLDPEQQEVYDLLVRHGVLPARGAGRDAA
jgi:hypothetical protein